jgi:RHS repeat-associated protein
LAPWSEGSRLDHPVRLRENGRRNPALFNGNGDTLETDGNNVTQVIYTVKPEDFGNIISQHRGSGTSYYHFDGLGSTTQLTNASGATTDQYLYNAFGNLLSSAGTTTNAFRFIGAIGYYFDNDTATYYIRRRYYDSQNGRFVSPDSIDSSYGGLFDYNNIIYCYPYVFNNPANFLDPISDTGVAANAITAKTCTIQVCVRPVAGLGDHLFILTDDTDGKTCQALGEARVLPRGPAKDNAMIRGQINIRVIMIIIMVIAMLLLVPGLLVSRKKEFKRRYKYHALMVQEWLDTNNPVTASRRERFWFGSSQTEEPLNAEERKKNTKETDKFELNKKLIIEYHTKMANKYKYAHEYPWLIVWPDPAEPSYRE